MEERRLGLSGSTLKIIAVISMVLDHLSRIVLTNGIMIYATRDQLSKSQWAFVDGLADITSILGRIAFPIFCFLIVEGFIHTHNLLKYILTMFVFALATECVYDYVFSGSFFCISMQNVMFEFVLALIMLSVLKLIEKIWKNPQLVVYVVVVAVFSAVAEALYLDGGMYGILLIAVFYWFRNYDKFKLVAAALVMVISACHIIGGGFEFNLNNILDMDLAAELVSLIPIALYNGKRGLKLKYFFYVFYPGHLAVLYGLLILTLMCL